MTPPTAAISKTQDMMKYYNELFGFQPDGEPDEELDSPLLDRDEATLVYEETIHPGEGRPLGGTITFELLSKQGKPGERIMDMISRVIDANLGSLINSLIRDAANIRIFHVVKGQIYERRFS